MKTPPEPRTDHRTSVLLVDDHAMFRKGLRLLLDQEAGLRVVAEAGDGQSAIEQVRELSPDVVVMDVTMPKFNGIEATRRIVAEFPQTLVVALSVHAGRQFVEDMLQAGAAGYILKESAPEELVKGIETVARGEIYLSPAITRVVVSQFKKVLSGGGPGEPFSSLTSRDTEFLKLIADGKSPKQIARAFRIKPDTLRARQQQIKAKIGVESDEELTAYAEASLDRSSQPTEPAAELTVRAILQTKLHPPSLNPELVSRPQLLQKLNANPQRPLTLVSAPAGYGKSTLVAQWLQATKTRSAWLSLGAEDSDPRVFLSYFVAAVRTRYPKGCRKTAELLLAHELPALPVLTDVLSNDLEALPHALILVFDDYHLILGTTVHNLLNELLRFPSPRLRLVLLTRRDPPIALAPLRARGQLREIVQHDLQFSGTEIQAVLKQSGNLTLNRTSLLRVEQEMEGWIAGLHLLCLALRNQKDPDKYLSQLTGGIQHVNEYLVEEVLSQQSASMQNYLLKTSLLDQFSAPLCEATSIEPEKPEGKRLTGEDFIRQLQQDNLFAIPLDNRGEWFRYHHLFQQLLQQQLRRRSSSIRMVEIHSRASDWFEGAGFLEEAIDHALATGDPTLAARIIERHRLPTLEADDWPTLAKWLAKVPREVLQQRVELLLAAAWVTQEQYRLSELPAILELAESNVGNYATERTVLGELDFFRSYLCFWEGDGRRSQVFLDQAVEMVPETASGFVRSHIELQVGLTGYINGQKESVIEQLTQWIEKRPAKSGILWERDVFARATLHLLDGALGKAASDARILAHDAQRSGKAFVHAWARYLHGNAALQAMDLSGAQQHFRSVLERRYAAHTMAAVDGMAGFALSCQLAGDERRADQILTDASEYALWTKDPVMAAVVDSCRARLALLRGDIAAAAGWQRSLVGEPVVPTMLFFLESPWITSCRVSIGRGTEASLKEAMEKLECLRETSSALHYNCQTIEVLVLQSLARQKQGRENQAVKALKGAIDLAEPGGCIRPFVEPGPSVVELLQCALAAGIPGDFARTLLDAAQKDRPGPISSEGPPEADQPLIEPLTNRELDVLELVVQRLQDKEIADRLSVSPQTVKVHLKHIYQKLGVSGRRQASQRGVELGLVKSV